MYPIRVFDSVVRCDHVQLIFKRSSGARFYTFILCPRWFCTDPLFWGCVFLYLQSPKGGRCSLYICLVLDFLSFFGVSPFHNFVFMSVKMISWCDDWYLGGTNCALPFTTNVTISSFMSNTFCSWVATFNLRQPMAFLSHNWHGLQGLAPFMNVLFGGFRDFHISFSNRAILGNDWNRFLESSMVEMAIPPDNLKSPSSKCYMTFWELPHAVTLSIVQTTH